jgi:outer membrane murein-binding lipoprotein Lpp
MGNGMKNIFNFIAIVSLLSLAACGTQNSVSVEKLRAQDDQLNARANELFLQKNKLPQTDYVARLEALRAEELQLLELARKCDFGQQINEQKYWQLSRLKFPGKIQLELERMKA